MTTYLIFGASRGLGAAFADGLPVAGDIAWLLSRGRPAGLERQDGVQRHWLPVDLLDPMAAEQIKQEIGPHPLDVLLYNAGIWETAAFSPAYDFESVAPSENMAVLTVNLTAPLTCIQVLLSNLRQSNNGKIILIGSTSGLDNTRAPEVAYNASKFGLRGLAHGLREQVRPDFIGVTLINPGTINTGTPLAAGIAGAAAQGEDMIPLGDLVELTRAVINLSKYSCVKEINMPSMLDPHV